MKEDLIQLFTVAGLQKTVAYQVGSEGEYQSVRVTLKKMVLS